MTRILQGAGIIFFLIFVCVLVRDAGFVKRNPDDLRNRVVGARLIKDGYSPYFYKWKNGDGARYYDPKAFDTLKVSNITASPFFHHLLYPLAELSQREISVWWLVIEYVMFSLSVLMALALSATDNQKLLVFITGGLFLLTEGWKVHVLAGQNYLFVPFLAMLFYYFFSCKKNLVMAFLAGLVAVVLVLVRPNMLIFFIPFLLLYKQHYSKSYLIAFFSPVVLICILTLADKKERSLWIDYKLSIVEQIKLHQKLSPMGHVNDRDPHYVKWEGMDREEMNRLAREQPVPIYSENGNVFVIAGILFHRKISIIALSFACIVCLLSLFLICLLFQRRKKMYTLAEIALISFCFYMLTDFFSPVYRWQYYTVQWLFPIMVASSAYKPSQRKWFFIAGAGLILNILNGGPIPFKHTAGEYILLVSFITLSLANTHNKEKQALN